MSSMRIYHEDGEIKVESDHLILPIHRHMIDKVIKFHLSSKDGSDKTLISLKEEYMNLLKGIPYTPFQVTLLHQILNPRSDLRESNIVLYYNSVKLLTKINPHSSNIKNDMLFNSYGAKYFVKINKNDAEIKLYLKMAWG